MNSARKLGAVDFGPTALIDLDGYELRWFDHWLKAAENGIMAEAPVRIFVMGRNEWQDQADWPIRGTQFVKYYLSSNGRANSLFGDGTLSAQAAASVAPDRFMYNPLDPVPFIMESTYAQLGGPDDYRPVERRDDVLIYTSDSLDVARVICGPVRAHLSASSSAVDTDFMVKLIDVITSRLDAHSDSYLATLPSLRLSDVRISPELVSAHERMLTGGFYAEIQLEYDASVAQETGGKPFGVVSLRPIQLSKRGVLEDLIRARAAFTVEQWKHLLLRSIGLEPAQGLHLPGQPELAQRGQAYALV